MNFLEICKKVDIMSGVQGMIASVENPVGVQEVIVNAVQQGFIDLQNERMTWEWMRRTKQFHTQVNKQTYTYFDIFGVDPVDPPADTPWTKFGRWQKKKPMISYRVQDPDDLKWSKCIFVDYREFRHHLMNQQSSRGKPRYVTADEQTNDLLFHPTPNKAYLVEADYFVEAQVLTRNANVPIIPLRFRMVLVYRGLERVGNFYGNMGLYQRYATADAKMTGNLYRDQVPGEFVVIRSVA